ncbi:MAG: GltB/FmdC/FwdC-like GXGXG domain-containing protein [Planctomycetota bacterium]|jgi:glutamate synthase domain-containing protein 1/glutamate synthase domain-containing protein 3
MSRFTKRILASRKRQISGLPIQQEKAAEEGGCGVVGFAASIPVHGRHIFEPSIQMHNRGNGKGGGITAACLIPEQLGVDAPTLRDDYILQIALLDANAEKHLEDSFIAPQLRIDHKMKLRPVADYREFGLEVRPPNIVRYFVRVKEEALSHFAEENSLTDAPTRMVEDEFIYQNSFRLNKSFYASLGEKRAFVLSHARNLMIFKIVGYAEQVVQYYGLEDLKAQVWIAHQRYPTKGRVWHPAGSHPFIGMNEALVHNGDFANYFSICEYLRQHNIVSLFLTDTEVSVLLFDLWRRIYGYPIEYVIEALAPTTELDFVHLPDEKKKVYRAIQALHMHGSPDGPWFFIIARSDPDKDEFQLMGITDTSMLRPQVFALQEGDVTIGLVASEKQAIDATLHSLAQEDSRFRLVADRYWNARGGSYTDGGAFVFNLQQNNGQSTVSCTDKFGTVIKSAPGKWVFDPNTKPKAPDKGTNLAEEMEKTASDGCHIKFFERVVPLITSWNFDNMRWLIERIEQVARRNSQSFEWAFGMLSLLNDRRYDCGDMKQSVVLEIVREAINSILDSLPAVTDKAPGLIRRIDWKTRKGLRPPEKDEKALAIFAQDFPPEGKDCDAKLAVKAYQLGWRHFIIYGLKGQRFTGCGFGPDTHNVRIDVFGSSGDYLASGIDGIEIHLHGNGQDQLGQIMKQGTLVVYGDVGQAFMYGAKGGEVYVMGNAAGRPLINAAGRPRVVINGTCLDYLAESFMAGDPHKGGGFVVLNGIEFDNQGRIQAQQSPYPGSNLFSLASGGAIFVRDPHRKLVAEQLNGGEFTDFSKEDWKLIFPYLQANERYFGVSIERGLLTVDGIRLSPKEVYRKVQAVKLAVLAKEGIPE